MNVAADLRSPSYPRSTCQVRLFAIFVVVPGSTSAISQSRMYNYASTDLDEVRSFPLYLVYDLPSVSVDMTTGYSLGGTCYLRTRRKQPVPPCMLCIFWTGPACCESCIVFWPIARSFGPRAAISLGLAIFIQLSNQGTQQNATLPTLLVQSRRSLYSDKQVHHCSLLKLCTLLQLGSLASPACHRDMPLARTKPAHLLLLPRSVPRA